VRARSYVGIQLDSEGNVLTTALSERIIGIEAEELAGCGRDHRDRVRKPQGPSGESSRSRRFRDESDHPWFTGARATCSDVRTRQVSSQEEVPLQAGPTNAGLVIRVGDTVRRPLRPTSLATKALLDHLEGTSVFDSAPRYLGVDDCGREVLSFIPGQVALPPYPDWALTDDALISVALSCALPRGRGLVRSPRSPLAPSATSPIQPRTHQP